jgi:hypothetical protein
MILPIMAVVALLMALVTARGCCCGDDSVGFGDSDGGLGDNKSRSMIGTKKAGDL